MSAADVCQDCGRTYEEWFTDDVLWNRVMGGDGTADDPGGLLCPLCFTECAAQDYPGIVWRVIPKWTPTP